MSRARLTQRRVDALKPKARVYALRDSELTGFGVQVQPSGTRRYFVQVQHDGRRFFKVIGDAETLPVEDARRRAREAIVTIKRGDPFVAVDAGGIRFETVAEEVFRRYGRRLKRSTQTLYRSLYRSHLLPFFQGRAIAEIGPLNVHRWFASRPAPYAASGAVPVLSMILRQAEVYGYRPQGTNPAKGIRRYRPRDRERFLSPKELKRLARTLKRYEAAYPIPVAILWLLILTGCRKSEIGNLKWSEYREGHLFLEDSKSGPRTVWLSSAARAILDGLPRRGTWIFKKKSTQRPVRATERVWRRIRCDADLVDVRLHDLRHTYASIATMAGETILVVSKLLGHRNASTTMKYTHLSHNTLSAAANAVGSVLGQRGSP